MKLTTEQQQSVIQKLQHFLDNSCSCNAHNWILNDKVFELREFQGGGLIIGGESSVFPVITVTCKDCGNTYFFNAILLGVIEKGDGQAK
jgi:hypothetical protein